MHTTQIRLFSHACYILGAGLAVLLTGCGGTSLQSKSYGLYQDAVPAVYGVEGVAANGNITGGLGGPFFDETSGLGSPDGKTAYLTAATDFAILKSNVTPGKLLAGVDPNGTGKVPLGFSTGGQYIDASTQNGSGVVPKAVQPGASVVFRAAISTGISSSARASIPISYSGVTLSSSDPQWTLGTLPMTFNYSNAGPFANATYVTGKPVQSGNGVPTPFVLPFTTTGLHTVTITVTDADKQQTATTFSIVVAAPTDVAVFAQHITADGQTGTPTITPIPAGSVATITSAVTGAVSQATADAQGTIVLFTTPGARTLTVQSTDSKGAVTTLTQTLTIPGSAAGAAIIQ